MNSNPKEDSHLTQTIIQLIKNKKPENVQQLINLAKEKTSIPESKIVEHVTRLQSQEKITLKPLPTKPPQKIPGKSD